LAEAPFLTPKIWSLLKFGVLVPLAILVPVLLNGCAGVANRTGTSGFSVSGTISPATGGSGTILTLGGAATATTTADSTGSFTFSGLPNGKYTIVPSYTGFTFTPTSQTATVSGANVTGVNFTAKAAGATVSFSPTSLT